MSEKIDVEATSSEIEHIALPEQLLHQAQTEGYLLLDDLLAAIPEAEENMAQLEAIFAYSFSNCLCPHSPPW